MKVAEALLMRSETQTNLVNLNKRLLANVIVQEGEEPAENPLDILDEIESLHKLLLDIIKKINNTNINTKFSDGWNIMEAIAERDILKKRFDIYSNLAKTSVNEHYRYSKTEIKFLSAVNTISIQKEADKLAKDMRLIDNKIQAVNWTTELLN